VPRSARPADPATEADALRPLVQTFVRRFGLLVTKRTPCGEPVSTSHAHALMVLVERERHAEVSSQSDLGPALGIDKSNVARLCQRMERVGHVSQRAADADGRIRILTLTPKGTRLGQRIEAASTTRFRDIVARIPPRRRAALLDTFLDLNEALASLDGASDES
jgi:DNA-binding MarR family transcriptional regulator